MLKSASNPSGDCIFKLFTFADADHKQLSLVLTALNVATTVVVFSFSPAVA